jgi:hypothetical protein
VCSTDGRSSSPSSPPTSRYICTLVHVHPPPTYSQLSSCVRREAMSVR